MAEIRKVMNFGFGRYRLTFGAPEIRNYTMNFGFGRYRLTFREREKLAYAEVHRTDFANG